jgi:RimJ/RimL family protein N-acetyltransferase
MADLLSLRGRFVHLLPMGSEHVDALVEAAARDRSTFEFTPVPWDRATMADYVGRAIAKREAGEHLPFVTFSVALDRIVGSTRFYDLDRWDWTSQRPGAEWRQRLDRPDVASIGYTWLDPAAQRSPVNTEAKVLMMDHAFSQWEVWRVGIKTDVRNGRSRRAIERLGLDLDGVLRADMPGADGTVRDSAVYSMLAADWPAHRARLTARSAGPAGPAG